MEKSSIFQDLGLNASSSKKNECAVAMISPKKSGIKEFSLSLTDKPDELTIEESPVYSIIDETKDAMQKAYNFDDLKKAVDNQINDKVIDVGATLKKKQNLGVAGDVEDTTAHRRSDEGAKTRKSFVKNSDRKLDVKAAVFNESDNFLFVAMHGSDLQVEDQGSTNNSINPVKGRVSTGEAEGALFQLDSESKGVESNLKSAIGAVIDNQVSVPYIGFDLDPKFTVSDSVKPSSVPVQTGLSEFISSLDALGVSPSRYSGEQINRHNLHRIQTTWVSGGLGLSGEKKSSGEHVSREEAEYFFATDSQPRDWKGPVASYGNVPAATFQAGSFETPGKRSMMFIRPDMDFRPPLDASEDVMQNSVSVRVSTANEFLDISFRAPVKSVSEGIDRTLHELELELHESGIQNFNLSNSGFGHSGSNLQKHGSETSIADFEISVEMQSSKIEASDGNTVDIRF